LPYTDPHKSRVFGPGVTDKLDELDDAAFFDVHINLNRGS
jgi:hypothetical protein